MLYIREIADKMCKRWTAENLATIKGELGTAITSIEHLLIIRAL